MPHTQSAYDLSTNWINFPKLGKMIQILHLRDCDFTYREIESKLSCSHRTIRRAIIHRAYYIAQYRKFIDQPYFQARLDTIFL